MFVMLTQVNLVFAQPKLKDLQLPAVSLPPLPGAVKKTTMFARTAAALPPIVVLPLSCFVVGVTCSLLPVKLLDFSATRADDQTAALIWHSVAESDLSGYYIERSEDGAHSFTDRGFVASQNSGSTRKEYRFSDPNDLRVISYYRLRITNADGGFSYSELRPVKPVAASALMIAYPNPTRTSVNIRITALQAGQALMTWHDAAGRIVLEKNIGLVAGTVVFTEDVSKLAGAAYFITVTQKGFAALKANFYKL